jgi:predicted nucleic acid-binding protein
VRVVLDTNVLLSADANCLVTGDAELLSLGQFRGRPILSPRQLYKELL